MQKSYPGKTSDVETLFSKNTRLKYKYDSTSLQTQIM